MEACVASRFWKQNFEIWLEAEKIVNKNRLFTSKKPVFENFGKNIPLLCYFNWVA